VLDDPDGSGFLVYGLAAFTTGDAVYTGEHVRVTVSADGSKTERLDELSHGIIQQKADPGKEMVAVSTAQAVDTKYPVETWLYTSHLYHLPMYVAAKNGSGLRQRQDCARGRPRPQKSSRHHQPQSIE
jgi:hypothetical protein